jgi:hypothetical protein
LPCPPGFYIRQGFRHIPETLGYLLSSNARLQHIDRLVPGHVPHLEHRSAAAGGAGQESGAQRPEVGSQGLGPSSAFGQWAQFALNARRRVVRCVRLKQCKRAKPTVNFLVKCGVPARRAWPLAVSGKGWWRRSGSPPANEAMTLQWFARLGLVSLQAHHAALQPAGNRQVR